MRFPKTGEAFFFAAFSAASGFSLPEIVSDHNGDFTAVTSAQPLRGCMVAIIGIVFVVSSEDSPRSETATG